MEKEKLDIIFHALSDSTRRDIIEMLSQKEMTITEIADEYNISLVAISKHLKTLEKCGIVEIIKVGRVKKCRLHSPEFSKAISWINTYGKIWRPSDSRLERELRKLRKNKTK